ncbi:unnamed protein product [Ilex paraguariensis]|uniref:BTB domain-containing protein n=1 Tax=Ilex paraguariensis TaxID=185542 RepID=A0ABC8S9C4_9AQUA
MVIAQVYAIIRLPILEILIVSVWQQNLMIFNSKLTSILQMFSGDCHCVGIHLSLGDTALLHFIYWDSLPDMEDLTGLDSQWASTLMSQHMLAAADRYGLDRLRLLCEANLCVDVAINTVATTLALAEQHHCLQLKSICLEFIAMPENLREALPGIHVEAWDLLERLLFQPLMLPDIFLNVGYKRFFKRTTLETSDYLKDDCLIVNCTVGVVRSHTEGPKIYSIPVPPSDFGQHFGQLLESGKGTDVGFEIDGEIFSAHKLVLAARSPVFRAQFFGPMKDQNSHCIIVEDMEAPVFKNQKYGADDSSDMMGKKWSSAALLVVLDNSKISYYTGCNHVIDA